eukprot:scaffold73_cov337-Pavlova_lutheri.AAC.50
MQLAKGARVMQGRRLAQASRVRNGSRKGVAARAAADRPVWCVEGVPKRDESASGRGGRVAVMDRADRGDVATAGCREAPLRRTSKAPSPATAASIRSASAWNPKGETARPRRAWRGTAGRPRRRTADRAPRHGRPPCAGQAQVVHRSRAVQRSLGDGRRVRHHPPGSVGKGRFDQGHPVVQHGIRAQGRVSHCRTAGRALPALRVLGADALRRVQEDRRVRRDQHVPVRSPGLEVREDEGEGGQERPLGHDGVRRVRGAGGGVSPRSSGLLVRAHRGSFPQQHLDQHRAARRCDVSRDVNGLARTCTCLEHVDPAP